MLLVATLGTASEIRSPRGSGAPGTADVVPSTVIIKVKPGVDLTAGSFLKSAGSAVVALRSAGVVSVRRAFPNAGRQTKKLSAGTDEGLARIYFADIPAIVDPRDAAQRLARMWWVEYAEPKFFHKILDVPNDPFVGSQTATFARLNAFNGWSVAKGSGSVAIATVDGGTFWQHEDLLPNLWINSAEDINHNGQFDRGSTGDENRIDEDGNGFVDDVIGWNFTLNGNDPLGVSTQPENRAHGTATASHFGAVTNNSKGIAGTSWNCSLMPICAAARNGDRLIEFGFEGIEYAFRAGAKVINCSWGRGGGSSRFEQEVINAAAAAGALVVVAAGNDGLNIDYLPQYPASYKNVLAVGATNSTSDVLASFSDYGMGVTVYAPGVNIWAAFSNGTYGIAGSGTSFSSPLVAGLAGILMAQHPAWTPREVAAQIRLTADSIDTVSGNSQRGGKLGHGRVNFGRAVTESHPAMVVDSFRLFTPAGKELFIRGDSIFLSVTIRNIHDVLATNLQFQLKSLDPEIQVLSGAANIPALAPGQSLLLPPFVCMVSPLTARTTVTVLKLDWVSNGNVRDAYPFRANVYPSVPLWTLQPSATSDQLFSVRAVDRNVVWAAGGDGAGSSRVIVRTVDGGLTWTDVKGDIPAGDFYCITAVDSIHAWVGSAAGQIFGTTDGGRTWNQQIYGGAQSPFIDGLWFFNSSKGFALGDPPAGGSQYVVLRTTDGGTTWNHLADEPVGGIGEASYSGSFWWSDSLHGWFGSNAGRIWRTTDGGNSWLFARSGGTNSYGLSFGDLLHGVVGHENNIVARTNDGGASWATVGFPSIQSFTSVAFSPGSSFAWVGATTDIGSSRDGGSTWGLQQTPPFAGRIMALSFSDTINGWAVTTNGEILKFTPVHSDSNGGGSGGTLPEAFGLAQNYPNPFNGGTKIRFDVVRPSKIGIVLYDLLGRKVRTVVETNYPAGTHEVRVDASGLASGMYLYRLTATAEDGDVLLQTTRKMVLIR